MDVELEELEDDEEDDHDQRASEDYVGSPAGTTSFFLICSVRRSLYVLLWLVLPDSTVNIDLLLSFEGCRAEPT